MSETNDGIQLICLVPKQVLGTAMSYRSSYLSSVKLQAAILPEWGFIEQHIPRVSQQHFCLGT